MGRTSDPRVFAARLDKRADQIITGSTRMVRPVARAMLNTLAQTTRVDTARAVSNWVTRRRAPFVGQVSNFPAGKKGSTRAEAIAQVLEKGNGVIAQHKSGEPLFFSNNVPYIGKLEGMDGMAKRAVAAGQLAFNTRRKKIFK